MIAAKVKEPGKVKAEAPRQQAKQQPASPQALAFNPVWQRLALRVQAKLAVSTPDDPYEGEADRIAEQVMRMPEPRVQRTCAACEEEEKLQRKESGSTADAHATPEADTAAAMVMRAPRTAAPAVGVPAIQLGSTGPLVARQPAPKPAAPAPCTINCTDPAFLTLSPSAREAQLNTQCPQGFPASGNTFFGQSIPTVSKTLRTKLLDAQSRAMRAMCLGGQDPNAFALTRSIITYAKHSPAMDKAVDIDMKGQPYIMHEVSQGTPETEIDKEVGEVYDRIAFWTHYRKSIVPQGITSVQRPAGGTGTQRTWTNPNTGKQEPITTGELYDLLNKESTGIQGYFNLLLKSDSDLTIEVYAFLVFNDDPLTTLTKLGLPTDRTAASVQAFRQRIADDYRLLGGSYAQLKAFAGKPIADSSKAPPAHHGDRPFEGGVPAGSTLPGGAPDPAQNRRPELGFISLPKEVVVALTEVGLVWGAIDFGGASGDVMHFDCRNIPNC